jgi:sigma-70-like protein
VAGHAASRAVVDEWRSVRARRRREETVAALEPSDQAVPSGQDHSLALLLMCCHPALPVSSQLALTLRAVGGLTTAEIARAFLVPEATMAKRISRASSSSAARASGSTLPPAAEWAGDLDAARLAYQRAARMTTNLPRAALPDPARRPAELTRQPAARRRLVFRASMPHQVEAAEAHGDRATAIAVPGERVQRDQV